MWSLSDRQDSVVTMSGWLGTRKIVRDLPQNMREMGESTELTYSCPSNVKFSVERERITGAPWSLGPTRPGSRLVQPLHLVFLRLE